ncbi:MAG TPA: hypothetical protein VIK78_06085 [Ruminiclostridium sp.]
MEQALNFRTLQGQVDYYKAYEETLKLWDVEYSEKYIQTSYGKSHCIICGDRSNPPLVFQRLQMLKLLSSWRKTCRLGV